MGTPIHSPNTSYQIIPPLSLQPTQELMQILQFHPILNHSSSDIPNSASSFSTEFEGGCIAHAAGTGNGGHGAAHLQREILASPSTPPPHTAATPAPAPSPAHPPQMLSAHRHASGPGRHLRARSQRENAGGSDRHLVILLPRDNLY